MAPEEETRVCPSCGFERCLHVSRCKCEHDKPTGLVHKDMFEQVRRERDEALAEVEQLRNEAASLSAGVCENLQCGLNGSPTCHARIEVEQLREEQDKARDQIQWLENMVTDLRAVASLGRNICERVGTEKLALERELSNTKREIARLREIRFVEVEDENGKSIQIGRWHENEDGLRALKIEDVLKLQDGELPSMLTEIQRLKAKIQRLNEAKTIVLGRCKVIAVIAHKASKNIENEVLLVDAAGRKACIGEDCSELSGTVMENINPRLLARLVVAHPDGASVLITQLEEAAEAAGRLCEEG